MGNGGEAKDGVKSAAINCHRYISNIGSWLCGVLLLRDLVWGLTKIAWQILGSAVNYSQPKGNICSRYGKLNSFIIFCVSIV